MITADGSTEKVDAAAKSATAAAPVPEGSGLPKVVVRAERMPAAPILQRPTMLIIDY